MPPSGSSDPLAARDSRPAGARRADLVWGVREGAVYAAAFCVLGAVGYVLGDGTLRARVRHGALAILAVYWLTGLLGGLLIGACRPALARLWVALLVGWAVGTLFIGAIMVSAEQLAAFGDWRTWVVCAGVGALVGMLSAGLRWSREQARAGT